MLFTVDFKGNFNHFGHQLLEKKKHLLIRNTTKILVRTSRPTLTEASISQPVKIQITTRMCFSGDVYFKLLKSWSKDVMLLKP